MTYKYLFIFLIAMLKKIKLYNTISKLIISINNYNKKVVKNTQTNN